MENLEREVLNDIDIVVTHNKETNQLIINIKLDEEPFHEYIVTPKISNRSTKPLLRRALSTTRSALVNFEKLWNTVKELTEWINH